MQHTLTRLRQHIDGAHLMRDGALAVLSDDDLSFSPGGDTRTLGGLLLALGELQWSYIHSLQTGTQDWSYRQQNEHMTMSIARLTAWFRDLDQQMQQTLGALTEDDRHKPVDRGDGVIRTMSEQLEIYLQALLIFFGKLVVYLQAMRKPLPPALQYYIA